jgi:S-adenosylmethionine synthetase
LYEFKDKLIDTSVKGIIEKLNLRQPIYSKTSVYGHFGKEDLPWEKLVKV